MSDRLQPCTCGAPAPASVSIIADENRFWQSILECPACGLLASACAHEAIPALIHAVTRWNTLTGSGRLYRFPGARQRS